MEELQTAKTMSPLVQQCQKALPDISTWHTVGLYWVPGHAGVRGNEIADRLAKGGSIQNLWDLSRSWGSLSRILKIKCDMVLVVLRNRLKN
jgi:hypothetical protein